MDKFFTAIKNQLSFNKMLESQLQQLANIVPANQGKILGQPKNLEIANLVDIFNAESYWSDPISKRWNDETLPTKKGDPGRPVISISIGSVNFNEAIYDFGASINILPKVVYDKMFNYPLLYTTMFLQLADQSLCYTKGILKDPTIECTINRSSFQKAVCDTGLGINIMAKVTYEYLYGTMPLDPTYAQLQMADQSFCFMDGIAKNVPMQIDDHFIPTDFLVIDMGEDEYDPPIILGRPFLSTTRAIIYLAIGEVGMSLFQ
jgi:hypothetical protein